MIFINQERLDKILHEHELWLKSKGKRGKKADLSNFDLGKVPLKGFDLLDDSKIAPAVLRGADLRGADLRRASLFGVNLTGANLRGANLERAKLIETDLTGANLKEANLEYAYITKNVRILGNVIVTEVNDSGQILSWWLATRKAILFWS